MPQPVGFPPILAIVAVLVCAGLLIAFYQALFPRPARWLLVAVAFVLGALITAGYAALLSPASERLAGITDAWSALRAMALIAGLPEEAVKLAATMIALLLFRRSLTPAEGFQAALVAALGFAALENLQYARALPEAAVLIAGGRGIVASFVHSMMAMFQGTFIAAFIRSGWRRWHLLILGYAAAALAHSLFDWPLVRPLLEYLRTHSISPETLLEALPIAPFALGVIVVSLVLLVRALRVCGREDPRADDPAHLALRRRWQRVGNVLIVAGVVGLVGSIAAVVVVSQQMAGQPQPTDISQVTPEELRASVIMTAALAASPMLIICGILVRQKQ